MTTRRGDGPEFAELKPPLSKDEALAEANRCLYCYDAPCTRACPTHIDVPAFIKKIASGNLRAAANSVQARSASSRINSCRVAASA